MEIRTKTIERLRDALLASGSRKGSVTSSAYRTLARAGLLSDPEKEALERVDSVAETMFLVIAADEQVTDTELAALRGAIRGLTGDVLSDDIVHVMLESYAVRLRDDGLEKRLTEIGKKTIERAEAHNTFSLAAAVAIADNDLAASESHTIRELKKVLELSDADVALILGALADDAS